MTEQNPEQADRTFGRRLLLIAVSVVVMVPLTVFVGYGVGLILAIVARLGGPDPTMEDGDRLRDRLLDWPERNREFMRTDGRTEFPWPP